MRNTLCKKYFLIGIITLLMMFPFLFLHSVSFASPIIIDHTCTDLNQVPANRINEAKALLKIAYGHTSHGSQIVTGMTLLKGSPGSLYWFDRNGTSGGLSLHDREPEGDLGNPDRTTWAARTRDLLNATGNDRNMIMWSWCGQVSNASEADINTYLNLMNQLEMDYPNVTFIYMTGHLDGGGETGNLHIRNNQIRDYCKANSKILFDFADIESYDPDGNYFLDLDADDQCNYTGGNWADQWCAANPGECESCSCAHSRCLNCQRKGRAFWWMMARIAGWETNCLPAPANLTAIPHLANHEIVLSWTDNSHVPNEDNFIIQRQVNEGAWDYSYVNCSADTTTFIDSGLIAGTYRYRVVSHLDDDGSGNPCNSTHSNTVQVVLSYALPGAPSNLDSELNGFDITLTWSDNSDSEEGFILERSVDGGTFSIHDTIPANTETYQDEGLAPLHTYTYRLKARNSTGDSGYSNETSEYVPEGSNTIILKQGVDGYNGCSDAYLDSAHPNTNYGGTLYKDVLNDPKCNFAIFYDLPLEIMNKKILDAKISFYCWYINDWEANQYLDLYRITESWDEDTATWNERFSGRAWTAPGGTFNPVVLDRVPIQSQAFYPEFDITPLVQKWVDNILENFGVLLMNDSPVVTGIKASEYSEYGRPVLEISYTSKSPCYGDFNGDGDVDDSDLAVFTADFGRTNCASGPPCEGDFDNDADVDGSDLAAFATDFGRTNCPPNPE